MKVINKKGNGNKKPLKSVPKTKQEETDTSEKELTLEQQYLELINSLLVDWLKKAKLMGHVLSEDIIVQVQDQTMGYFQNRLIFGMLKKIGVSKINDVISQEDIDLFNSAMKVSPSNKSMKSVETEQLN
jgi:hypothetical protein